MSSGWSDNEGQDMKDKWDILDDVSSFSCVSSIPASLPKKKKIQQIFQKCVKKGRCRTDDEPVRACVRDRSNEEANKGQGL